MNDEYRVLLKRVEQCEDLAKTAKDKSVREKCAELASFYRRMAEAKKPRPTLH